MWEVSQKQSCIRGLQQVDCYQKEWGLLSVSLGSSFPESSDNINNAASYYCRLRSLARSVNSRSREHHEEARQEESWNNHHKYMVFSHSHVQNLHTWHMKEGSDHRREQKNEVRWEESSHHNPTETGANVRHQVETLEKRKVEILYCFWVTEDDTLLRLFQVFFSKQWKIAACRYFASSNKELLASRLGQMHYWLSNISCVFTGAFIKLQTYASLTRNHPGYTEYLTVIYTKAALLIQCKGSLFCVASIHLLHHYHFVKRPWNKWGSCF